MPPIRRYLRITKFTVLEVRIYLSQPSQLTWLLRGASPALGRVISAIRPLVLPKLREENERATGKAAAKKKGVKDVIAQDDFEVAIFFMDASTRHSLLTKSIVFSAPKKPKALTEWLEPARTESITNEDEPIIIREESPESTGLGDVASAESVGEEDDDVYDDDEEKKAPNTSYEGFSIYGRVLCLVIKRTNIGASDIDTLSSQQMMEKWVSTQAVKGDTDTHELG